MAAVEGSMQRGFVQRAYVPVHQRLLRTRIFWAAPFSTS